jgi:IS30 family transposase
MTRKGYHHMTRDQRCQLQVLKSRGLSQRKIAEELGVSASTICREIAKNSEEIGYKFKTADEKSSKRRSSASQIPKKLKGELKTLVLRGLEEDWSPDQIAGRLKLQGIFINRETIYRYIRRDRARGGLIYEHLRHGGKKYRFKKSRQAGVHCIPNRVGIEERPAVINEKLHIGHWEGDTVISSGSRCALVTLVERHSKYLKMRKIGKKTMKNTSKATINLLKKLKKFTETITYDNGKEFADHQTIAKALGAKIYFARPYKSCDRGLNEHTNGLIRQYLPKKRDFSDVMDKKIREIERKLNNRPRKVLMYKTPLEVFSGLEAFSTQNCAHVALHL